jgi:hypothetical protein
LWHLEQLHSEDIWQTDYSLYDKLFKPFVKAHGQRITHPNRLSTLLLLVVVLVVELLEVVEAAAVY